MTAIQVLETERLIMRRWTDSDKTGFAQLNADSDVMEYYPNLLNRQESDVLADKIISLINERGWGLWAVELKKSNEFIGFVGLHKPHYDLPFTPCVEIGWRLAKAHWGRGYATEAARRALAFAFNELNLTEVYSFTPLSNKKSCAVMQRINMLDTRDNFEHPMMPQHSPLREHFLYKIDRQRYFELNPLI